MNDLRMSAKGLQALQKEEGCVLHVYRDQAGLPTIGIGHLLTKSERTSGKIVIGGVSVKYADGITQQQALDLLAQDLHPAEDAVRNSVKVQLSQNQFDALVSFTFNAGTGGFTNSTMLKLLNKGQYDAVPKQMARWVYADGQVCDDLEERRAREAKLWSGLA
jgi:lysozyme